MKAKELMIDDYVSYIDTFGNRKQGKVTDLHHNESWETIYVDFCDQNPERKSKIRRVRPIPLTEEILQKNEFKKHTFNGTIIYSKKSFVEIDWYDVDVEISKDAEGIQRWDCVCIKIQKAGANLTLYNQSCFHQLQHALRLVGLNEMADNLKV